jgi:hypothetical protein
MSNPSEKAIITNDKVYDDDAQIAHFLFENNVFTSSGVDDDHNPRLIDVNNRFSSPSSVNMAVVPSINENNERSSARKAMDEFGDFESNFFKI